MGVVSFLPHAVIPALVALAFLPMERKRILALMPIAWLPDFDYLIPGLHRAVTTNVWIPLLLLGAVAVMWRRSDPTARFWEFATRPTHSGNTLLAAYYWASHVLLDAFAGGAVLFWPLLNTNFYWFYQIRVDTTTNTFVDDVAIGTSEGAPSITPLYTWFSSEHNAILWFLVAAAAVGAVFAWRRRTRTLWFEATPET